MGQPKQPRYYVLVSQTAWVMEWLRRDKAGQWIYTVFSNPADVSETWR